ncbi:phage integrase N-terminal SAM-like domain-containing protein [Rossellomorea sp. SC111]|uniref:site-specific integrase n=1 Tax=Rossellomorea sp. SC111 TaxID=2968985 RepID=UPI00215ADBE6|nr:phage integrase N-terminal SAM-like domain-containing protein [Rossellomorea sp. SC111]MCR8847791.1 phage integrase N-terminal SAM-like domain-containing protein [Rossellomorea sp. SC111]
MSRRKAVDPNVLEKLIKKQEQPVKDFQQASEEFFKHCKIKGLSPDTIMYYQKELKGPFRAFVEIDVRINDVRAMKTQDIENWVEHMLEQNRAVSSINARMRAGRTFMNYCLKKDCWILLI